MRFTLFKSGQWKHGRHRTHRKHQTKDQRRITNNRKLKSWISSASKSGYSNSEIMRLLELVGWDKKDIEKELRPKLDFVFLFAVAISLSAFAVLYYGPALLGAFAGVSEWENKIEIAASNSQQNVSEHIVFKNNKPASCADGMYVEAFAAGSAMQIDFTTENEIYENSLCKETDIEFYNIGYAQTDSTGKFSSQPIELMTYTIYYGKIISGEKTAEQTSTPEEIQKQIPEKEIINAETEMQPTQMPRAAFSAATKFRAATETEILVNDTSWQMFHHDFAHTGFYNLSGPTSATSFWNFTTTANAQMQSSPAIIGGIVYIGSLDDMVYAINATNGSKIWNFTAFDVVSSPAVVNNMVYIGANNLQLYALNATNGSKIWNYTLGSQLAQGLASPAVFDNKVYMPAGDPNTKLMYAFNATNGTQLRNFTTIGGNIQSSPAVVDNRVYFGDDSGNIYALNETNGSQIWSATPTVNAVDSSPAVVDNRVYIGADAVGLIVYNATNGTQLWNYSMSLPGIQMKSSPAVANGIVYFSSKPGDATLYALYATNGNLIWNRTNFQGGTSSPAVSGNGFVYIGEDNPGNVLRALNATNGTELWNLTLTESIKSSPALATLSGNDNILVASADDGVVYAFIRDVTPPGITRMLPENRTGFGINTNINISAFATDLSPISAMFANITLPNGTVQTINLSAVSGSTYSVVFNNTGLNGTYTARFIANDTYNNINLSVTTSFIVGGSTYTGVPGYNFTLENNFSAEVTRDLQFGMQNVFINETATNLFVARLKTNFGTSGYINLSGLIANSSSLNKKSVLFRQGGYPSNITSKDLFIPTDSFGLGMFICPIATKLGDVNDSCTNGYADARDRKSV